MAFLRRKDVCSACATDPDGVTEYRELNWKRLRETMALPLVADGRNLLDPESIRAEGFEYFGVG
jgi:hypothetical protein